MSTFKIDPSLRDRWTHQGESWQAELPTGWMQGRSTFGGLTAAMMAALGRRNVSDSTRQLRTTTVQLIAPVTSGAIEGECTVLRDGRSVSFVEVRLHQQGRLVARSTLVFAKERGSKLDVSGPRAAAIENPGALVPLPYLEGVMPEFTQHVEMCWLEGRPPFMGSDEPSFTGALRYRVPFGGVEGVLALLDTFPPPSLSLAKGPTFASTVSWTAHVLAIPETFDEWFTVRYEVVVGTGGLHTTVARLHDESGALVGWSEQLVAVFG